MSRFRKLKEDTKLMSGIYMLSLITALLILAVTVKGPDKTGSLVVEKNGSVTGINRESLAKAERYDLLIEVLDEEQPVERNVDLMLQAKQNSSTIRISDADDREAAINAGIDAVISEVEYSKKKKITLPAALPDGTKIIWRIRDDAEDGRTILVIIVMYISLAAVMTASRLRGDKAEGESRKSIMKGLPRFCNQLFLMMNAGLILSDAFDTITASYSEYGDDELSSFEKGLAELREATDGHRVSTAHVINEYAIKHDVKELIRISAILTENEKRGSDVIDSLSRESRYLWDERKIVARESGKMIDTKMSYPLGLLLILLIVITMAPALLNM